jgi:hypothetical protein
MNSCHSVSYWFSCWVSCVERKFYFARLVRDHSFCQYMLVQNGMVICP